MRCCDASRLPVALAALMQGIRAGVETAVLAATPPGALRLQNSSLISKLLPNFAQFDDALRSQGRGGPKTRVSSYRVSRAPVRSLSFLSLASPSWIHTQCHVSEGSFGEMIPFGEESGRPRNEGISSPSPLSGAARVSTADSASVPQPRGGGSRAAETRGAGRGQSPCCAVFPQTLSLPFYL